MQPLTTGQPTATSLQTWSVGVLCYNEAGTLKAVVDNATELLGKMASDYEIIVVDDGSTDGSAEILTAIAVQNKAVIPVLHGNNKGIGEAFRSIYTRSTMTNILVLPGDGQFDLNEIKPFSYISINNFVCFFRKENTIYNPFRNTLSLLNKKINQFFVGITVKDVNWVKIYKREDVAQLDLQLHSSLIESEIIAKLLFLGRQAIEVESKYLPRVSGVSKGSSFNIVRKAVADTILLINVLKRFRKEQERRFH